MKLKGYLYGCLFFLALACVYYIFNQSTSIEQFKNTKLLVLYVFHDYNDRVKHFIENCIFYDENVDFIVISNDKNNKFNFVVTVLPITSNISFVADFEVFVSKGVANLPKD